MEGLKLKAVAARLKVARFESGYKASKDFAKAANIAPSTYSQHENMKRALSIDNLFNYSAVLNINPGWLLTGMGSPIDKISNDDFKEKRILDRIRVMEKSGLIESSKSPIAESYKQISEIDTKLLKKVLVSIIPLIKKYSKAEDEIIDFCFEIYNAITMSNVSHDDEVKREMIRMCINSFFQGIGVGELNNVIEKVVS